MFVPSVAQSQHQIDQFVIQFDFEVSSILLHLIVNPSLGLTQVMTVDDLSTSTVSSSSTASIESNTNDTSTFLSTAGKFYFARTELLSIERDGNGFHTVGLHRILTLSTLISKWRKSFLFIFRSFWGLWIRASIVNHCRVSICCCSSYYYIDHWFCNRIHLLSPSSCTARAKGDADGMSQMIRYKL